MKTKIHDILFKREDVQRFVNLLGDQNPIYNSIEKAKSYGFPTIPLPPTMPMIAYKWIKTPWQLEHPVIHRRQKCKNHHLLFIDQTYQGMIMLTDPIERNKLTMIKQTLHLYDGDGILCFEGESHLIAGGVI
jgi:hypothetical protein